MPIYKCKIDMYGAGYIDSQCNIFKNKYHIKRSIK